MKFTACLISFILISGSMAAADPVATAPAKTRLLPKRVQVKETIPSPRPFHISAFYSAANQVNYSGQVNLYGNRTSFSATEQMGAAPGLAIGYLHRRPWSFGYGGAALFELARSMNGFSGNAGGLAVHGSYTGSVTTNIATAAANGNYSIGRKAYGFAGANYPLILTQPNGESLSGLPGYQAGLGYELSERFLIELSYRVVRLKGTVDSAPFNLQIDEATLPGYLLGLHYLF